MTLSFSFVRIELGSSFNRVFMTYIDRDKSYSEEVYAGILRYSELNPISEQVGNLSTDIFRRTFGCPKANQARDLHSMIAFSRSLKGL
jgi:hypothetical protein